MSILLPPSELRCVLDSSVMDRRHLLHLPPLASCEPARTARGPDLSRRGFMAAATAALAVCAASAQAAEQLVFSPDAAPPAEAAAPQTANEQLRLGEIPPDFWMRPRELRLLRQGSNEQLSVVYWKDGTIVADGYWRICSLMRDVHANVMTTMDPTMLDVLRGVLGYYEAWKWPYPLVITSGYRTPRTNDRLSREGAAKNSMHLYGRAADLYMPGVPARDVGLLGMHLSQGGVGFYPSRGFTHLDTGRLRVWRG